MGLEHLTDVHPARHTERVEDDVDGRAVGEVGHVLEGQDLGDDALVAVASGELVADRDLALLGDVHPHQLVDIVPGGATPASFMSYGIAKKVSRDGDKFGTGVVEGVVAPETAATRPAPRRCCR